MTFTEALEQIKYVGPDTVQAITKLNTPLMDCFKQDVDEEEITIFQDRLRAMLCVLVGKLSENVMQGVTWNVGLLEEQDFINIRQAVSKFEGEKGSGSFQNKVEELFEDEHDEPLSQVDTMIQDQVSEVSLVVDKSTERLIVGNEPLIDEVSGKIVLKDQEGYVRVYRLLHTLYVKHDDISAQEDVRDIINELAIEGQIFSCIQFSGLSAIEVDENDFFDEDKIRRENGIPLVDKDLDSKDVVKLIGLTYAHMEPKISGYVKRRLGYNPEMADVEDIVARTFLNALKNPNCNSSFSGWIYRIAHNLVIDYFRKNKPTLSLDNVTEDEADIVLPSNHDTAKEVMGLVGDEILYAVIRSLTDDQSLVLSLRFLQELSIAETALIMDRKEGAIKALQYRAVVALREKLLNIPGFGEL